MDFGSLVSTFSALGATLWVSSIFLSAIHFASSLQSAHDIIFSVSPGMFACTHASETSQMPSTLYSRL